MNKYPIYIPSLGRVENFTTALLNKYDIDYKIFVEERQYKDYESWHGQDRTVSLEGNGYGNSHHVRNFMKQYGKDEGYGFHWELDDDIKAVFVLKGGKNCEINPTEAFANCETFVSRYKNIGMAGLSADTFVKFAKKPFGVNTFAYTCFLLNHATPCVWRDLEDDLDYNLQLLTSGWCTVRFNIYNFKWNPAEGLQGGHTELRADNKRLDLMKATIKQWPMIPGIDPKANGKFRLKTEGIWKQFKQNPTLIRA